MRRTAILILAAGKSSRMGKPKQLLKLGSETLIEHAIKQALQSNATTVVCILGAYAEEIKSIISHHSKCEFVVNEDWESGLSSSLKCGIHWAQEHNYEAAVAMLADQPLIDSDFINEILQLANQHPESLIAANYGEKRGVPALFPKPYFNQLLKLKGDTGAGVLLNNPDEHVITVEAKNRLIDLDTPEDYARFLRK